MEKRFAIYRNLPSHVEISEQLKPLRWYETWATVAIPLLSATLYFVFAFYELYPLAFAAVFYLSFATYGSCSHDLVHANCGLRRKHSHFWLSVIELIMLRSGTVYRMVHLNHHRVFPNYEKDPEGRASYYSLWRTLLEGPIFQFRLCAWAWSRRQHRPRILLELLLCAGFLIVGIVTWSVFPALLIFQMLVVMGSWIIPFITSYLVHLPDGEEPTKQTRLFRGAFFRLIAMDHLYHLEHHLYPMVPHYRWAELAKILNPYFAEEQIPVIRFPSEVENAYQLN